MVSDPARPDDRRYMNIAGSLRAAAVLLLLSIGAGWASAGRAQLFDAGDLSGEELFGRYCSACHGQEARGDGPVAVALRAPPPNLRQLAERSDGEFPAAAVRQTIDGRAMSGAHGTREMPIWGYEFWVEEGADRPAEQEARRIIDSIVAYLRSIQEVRGQSPDLR